MNLNLDLSEFKESNTSSSDSNINKGLKMILGLILDSLTPELCRQLGLKLLEVLEDLAKKTDNKVDDMIVASFTNKIRELLGDTENHSYVTDNSDIKNMLSEKMDELSDEIDSKIQTTIDISNPSSLFNNISEELTKYKRNNPFEN